ncbi:hypothetical protein F2Q68_00032545 [Brassica cretica]|uniref:Uncharacterized protein n=1 Tax=Brassica cretica TaxID=69181 RepID=A0A8S9G9K7_BRACR|nr:hypothetical protein F2Q68_00032545 [Brassica cretica]
MTSRRLAILISNQKMTPDLSIPKTRIKGELRNKMTMVKKMRTSYPGKEPHTCKTATEGLKKKTS